LRSRKNRGCKTRLCLSETSYSLRRWHLSDADPDVCFLLTDANFNPLGLTNSATAGQAVTLWGWGVCADTSNADTTYPQNQNNLTNIPMQVYIGGISANILYRRRSQ
jgi:uncharacterized protein (TIGR03437 family)